MAKDEDRGDRHHDSSQFGRLLSRYIALVDDGDEEALARFRKKHPEFVVQLGTEIDWVGAKLAQGRVPTPETIGPYHIVHALESGGMGDVYLGRRTQPFEMAVAVKVPRLGGGAARLERFATEIQSLARLSHDGIARIFEAGTAADGRPYFAMEYVPGQPITRYCAEARLGLEERLRLFVDVCRAVSHAHQKGILHRDLKPSNILVHGPASRPVAKIIDFGLAKAIDPADSAVTRSGMIIGTLDYLSPEQVEDAEQRLLDTRCDVYALGVVLYELLTGSLPLDVHELREEQLDRILNRIRDGEPTTPSARVERESSPPHSSPLADSGLSPRRLRRALAGDLDGIVMKALAKHAEDRYETASAFADDVERYLRKEPIDARPRTRAYVLQKFLQRHRLAATLTAVLAAGSIAAVATILIIQHESLLRLERSSLFGCAHQLQAWLDRDLVSPAPARSEHVPALTGALAELDTLLDQRDRIRSYLDGADSDAAVDQVLATELAQVLEDMDWIEEPGGVRDQLRRRLDWAGKIRDRSVERHADAWQRVRREVREAPYEFSFDLPPQVGLIPLSKHEPTGLQLFTLPLPGGDPPRPSGGRYAIGSSTDPVFVLLPGNPMALFGSQSDAPDQPGYDPEHEANEYDVERVPIEPFFASCYELTLGQYRLLDRDGTRSTADGYGSDHPVVNVNGRSFRYVANAWGMRLPTPQEHEYLVRGGVELPRWFGEWDPAAPQANIFDRQLLDAGGRGEGKPAAWADGFPVTAPVGSFPPNPFQIYDAIGNVFEAAETRTDDGLQLEMRSGSWHTDASQARATARISWNGAPIPSFGLRPVISLQR